MKSSSNDSEDHPSPIDFSEDSFARSFVDRHQSRIRYDHSIGRWFIWTGERWAPDLTQQTYAEIRHHIQTNARGLNGKGSIGSSAFASGVDRIARSDQRVAVTVNDWDQGPYLLGTPAGTIDLHSGKLRPADPAEMITKQAAVSPAESADCPLWDSFLREATGNDPQLISFLQRLFGYSLVGDPCEQKFVFVHGPGGNGKSVCINTVSGIFDDYSVIAAIETLTTTKYDRHPAELAMLQGARLVTASETEENRKLAVSLIKRITGNDPITARYMRQNPFTYQPQFQLIMVGNDAPQLPRVDDAMKRRILVIPFTQKPKVPDRKLEEKLRKEWPGILRWMIKGCVEWQASGLKPPAAVTLATQDYLESEDVFGLFLQECCEFGSDKRVWVKEIFKAWQEFARSRDYEPGTERGFAPQMKQRGFEKKTRSINGKPTNTWVGIKLHRSE